MTQTKKCEGIFTTRCGAEMKIRLGRGKNRLFSKHDSSFGEQTLLLTFDKQSQCTCYLMQLTAFGREPIGR